MNVLKVILNCFILIFALRLDAIPADIVIGFDCSSRSFSGHFGENTYGSNLYEAQKAFTKAKGNKDQTHGPMQQAPMLWSIRLCDLLINSYSFNIYEGLYGIGTSTAYSQDKILNLVTSLDEEPSDESIVSYVQNSIKQIVSQKEIGGDFDPLVFMNYVVSTLDKQQKPRLVTAMIFSSGQIEDSKREEVKNFLVRTSYLPIKWIFVNVGEEKTSSEIATIIKASHGKDCFFENAKVFSMSTYFDFDGISSWTKFDIDDSLKDAKKKKFQTDVENFVKKDYEAKVLPLIHARDLIIEVRKKAADLVSYSGE